MAPARRVAVIGGGIGGLSAAIALRRRGIDAQVYEQAPKLERIQVGGGLHLWTNAMKALIQLGLDERMRAMGTVIVDRMPRATGSRCGVKTRSTSAPSRSSVARISGRWRWTLPAP